MNADRTIVVSCRYLSDGQLFLHGAYDDGAGIPLFQLKQQLFVWHEPSFYGSLIESGSYNGKQGYLLPASMGLAYMADPPVMLIAGLRWDPAAAVLQRMAQLLLESLAGGWYKPSFAKHRQGRFGWELLLPQDRLDVLAEIVPSAEQHRLPQPEMWLDAVLASWMGSEETLASAWDEVAAAHPAVRSGLPSAANSAAASPGAVHPVYEEETEWLIAIGWSTDECPFHTTLQLVEPTDDEHWRLQLALHSRDGTGQPAAIELGQKKLSSGLLPAEWEPYLADQTTRVVARIRRAAPELFADEADAGTLRNQLTDDEAWTFMERQSLAIIRAGCPVALPSWWEQLRLMKPKVRAQLRPESGSSQPGSMLGLQQIVDFDWRIALGDLELNEAEFRRAVERQKSFFRYRGRWVHLAPEQLRQLLKLFARFRQEGMSLRDVLELHLLGAEDQPVDAVESTAAVEGTSAESTDRSIDLTVELNDYWLGFIRQLHDTQTLPSLPAPLGLLGALRPYQAEGFSWLAFLRRFRLGACLADDMGLGKTIQFISYLLHTKLSEQPTAPALLIAPTSVIGNWQKELERFAPTLQVQVHYGTGRPKSASLAAAIAGADLVITSYALSHLDEEELASVRWSCICLDEAQNIKNAETKQSSAIRRLEADHRIAMTGTPLENRLTELWSIYDFINPGYLRSLGDFTRRYVNVIERTNDAAQIVQVQRLVRPFLLRRLKKDPNIRLSLPEKNEAKTYVSLTTEQTALYESTVQNMLQTIETLQAMERRGLILATLTKLKQICNHPSLFTKEQAGRLNAERSNKLARLVEMVQEMRAEGEKGLVFTQFVDMGHILQELLAQQLNEPVLFLHGGVAKSARDRMIDRFQHGATADAEGAGLFILSLRAGGTGLNLTAANHVFHFDRWWNPAVENQATDRAYRIGQTRDVQVHKFIALGTIEERIDDMIERKQELSSQIVGSGENWITELSTSELQDLFMLRHTRAER
ncbi:DEAD/DEAH box helicase [Paenibacillus cymbidii]|uniref:DEAD/DEAH box helicase n=1 Tax=Paenibacillus cymbidii TaxID=1639034 RepID=UPI0014368E66|nr:DEAD/DEAH box helicase [Paenibacillus cymbidii]